MKTILLTGGTGFIGSHVCVEIIAAGWRPIILDNFCNSSARVIKRIKRIAGVQPVLVHGDVRSGKCLDELMSTYRIDAVIHLAGLKAVGESVKMPLEYYENNLSGSIVLLQKMSEHDIYSIVFSSSATVYGFQEVIPVPETATLGPTSPYGRSKYFVERIISDWAASSDRRSAISLRYFNPVGAHPSGLIGESPVGEPNNLMPVVSRVAAGILPSLKIFGGDYATPDGTGVRDYIHVMDLARGHIAALGYVLFSGFHGSVAVNLGTGKGHSVREVVEEFERQSGRKIPVNIVDRRQGDVAESCADVRLARALMGWTAKENLSAMCADSWRWQMSSASIDGGSELPGFFGSVVT